MKYARRGIGLLGNPFGLFRSFGKRGAEEWDSRNLRFSHFEQSPMLQHQWPYAGSELYVANLLGPRGNGIGSALLRSAGQEAIRRGAYRSSSLPAPSKPPEFYERLGCARQATIPNYP